MARCAVCGSPEAPRLATVRGEYLGSACRGECEALLWESHFLRVTGAPEWEHAEVLWRWKRRAAEVRGESFDEFQPQSPAEAALDRVIAGRGWNVAARELE
jgi:hypothetical protein